jgi:hypothetical protein
VWLLDGSTIGIIDTASGVYTYEVVSGKTQYLGNLHSRRKGFLFHQIWAHETSFRAIIVARPEYAFTINIFEIGRTLVKFHSFTSTEILLSPYSKFSFSPATFHICIYSRSMLHIFGDQDSNCFLEVNNASGSNCFSSDGTLFAASNPYGVRFWKYTLGCYIPWRELRDMRWQHSFLRISPTLSSILGLSLDVTMVCRLHDLPVTPQTLRPMFAMLVDSRNRIAVAREQESTIRLLDIHSQNPPQLIDTDMKITHVSVIGNVLLAVGSGKVVAWLLTEAGLVCGVLGDRRAGHGDSIWTIPCQDSNPSTSIAG